VIHPVLDHDFGFQPIAEPFERQAFVAELTVEALRRAVLPRFAWIIQGRLDLVLRGPL